MHRISSNDVNSTERKLNLLTSQLTDAKNRNRSQSQSSEPTVFDLIFLIF